MGQNPKLFRTASIAAMALLLLLSSIACLPQQDVPPQTKAPTVSSKQQAVVGGQVNNDHPAVGALVMKSGKRTFCTATLIGTRLLITAAHCATRSTSTVQFRIDRPSGSSFKSEYHDIQQQVRHPQYGRTSRGIQNDLAVVILTKDVTGITPMPINTKAMGNEWINRKIFFTGYGLIQTRPQLRSPNRKYSAEITLRRLSSDRFETRDTGKSICSGDSGGPALYKINGRLTLVGVNSYVTGTSSRGQPFCDGSGWDFRVDTYISWIQPYLSKYGGKCKTDADCGGCYTCNATSGKCEPKVIVKTAQFCTPCQGGTCGNGGVCQTLTNAIRCLQPCDANRCCPQGSTCQKVGGKDQCVPDQNQCPAWKCSTDKDCGAGESCQGGQCKPAPVQPAATLCGKCNSDADCKGGKCRTTPEGKFCTQPCSNGLFCPNGYSCQVVSGSRQCVPRSGFCPCKSAGDCYSGFACTNGKCLRQGGGKYGDVCDSQRPCAQGYKCVRSSNGTSRCYQACAGNYPAGSPGSSCLSGNRCQSGSRCLGVQGVGSLCFKTCRSNADCTDGGTCRNAGGVAICYCSADSQCKNGATCNRDRISSLGQCAKKSTGGAKCSAGFVCQSAGSAGYLCVKGASQRAGEECDSTRRCQSGLFCAGTDRGNSVCIRGCRSNADCIEGGSCITFGNTRFCGCNSASCKPGNVCKAISSRNKVCSPGPCKSAADCANNETCNNGRCEPKPGCTTDKDCVQGESCKDGKCVKPLGCLNDADCGAGKQCVNEKCVDSAPPCRDDSGCPAGQVCRSGACVPAGTCTDDSQCKPSEQCVSGKCQKRPGYCETDADCPNGFQCQSNRCVEKSTDAGTPEAGVQDKGATGDKSSGNSDLKSVPPAGEGCLCSVPSSPSELPWSLLFFLLLPLAWRRR